MKKVFVFVLLMLFCFAACKENIPQNENVVLSSNVEPEIESFADEYYEVKTNEDFTYSYCIRDKNGNKLISVENISRCPNIEMIGEHIVAVLLQTGTGSATNIVRYYNIETGEASDEYQYVLSETDEYVVRCEFDEGRGYSAIVSRMFDKKDQIISVPLEDVHTVEPIVSANLNDNFVEIVYRKGEDFIEETIEINIAEAEARVNPDYPLELYAKIEEEYERDGKNPDYQTTLGMIEYEREYAKKWKCLAERYYGKIIKLRDGIYSKKMAEVKENREAYFKKETECYFEILTDCFSDGSIKGPMFASYECELYKEYAKKIIDIYLIAIIPVL